MINFVEQSFDFVPQEPGIEGMYKMMERAARQCYKTEHLIKEGSAHKIIDDICIANGHTSVTEFGTVYLKLKLDSEYEWKIYFKYDADRYTRVNVVNEDNAHYVYITTTYRTILQGDYEDPIEAIKNHFDKSWKDDLKYWCEPTEHHFKRYCYHFVMDRVGSQSVERHRGVYGISYAQESTRYVNYGKDRFNKTITCCLPSKFYSLVDKYDIGNMSIDEQLAYLKENDKGWNRYESSLENDSDTYMELISENWKPEEARGALPLDIKTEFLMCAYPEDWEMWFFRRTDSHAHPQIQRVANELKADFDKRSK